GPRRERWPAPAPGPRAPRALPEHLGAAAALTAAAVSRAPCVNPAAPAEPLEPGDARCHIGDVQDRRDSGEFHRGTPDRVRHPIPAGAWCRQNVSNRWRSRRTHLARRGLSRLEHALQIRRRLSGSAPARRKERDRMGKGKSSLEFTLDLADKE